MKHFYNLKILYLFFLIIIFDNSYAQVTFSEPTLITTHGYTQGNWVVDPLETNGPGKIWVMPGYFEKTTVYEYASEADLLSNTVAKTYELPIPYDGTGHVVYGGNLYYNMANSNKMVKYNLATQSVLLEVSLPDAGFRNTYHYTWGGYSDIDFATDENGLWVLYSTAANSGRLVISKLDPSTLIATSTWNTASEPKTQMGNAFVINGKVYCIDSYSEENTVINYVYDTDSSTGVEAEIPWKNAGLRYGSTYLTSAHYNPTDGRIYAWDRGSLYTYTVTDPCLEDQINPTAIARDVTIFLDENGNASITAEEVDGGSSDNCSDITFEVDKLIFNCSDLGANTVTLTVEDESGNSSTAEAIVTVEDIIAPQAFCDSSTPIQNVAIISNSTFGNPLATSLMNNGYNVTYNGTTPPSSDILASTDAVFLIRIQGNEDLATWVQNGGVLITEWFASNWALNTANLIDATDNGGGHVGSDTQVAFTGTPIGQSLGTDLPNPYSDGGATEYFRNFIELGRTVKIHATRPGNIPVIVGDNAGSGYVLAIGYDYQDVGSNLSGSNTEKLILNALTANYIEPLVFQLDANGLASITAADIDNNSVDNCGIASISVFPDSFDCSNIGANTLTLTVTDESGNSSTCYRTIIIEDNIAPTITCPSEIIQPNDEGQNNAVVNYNIPTSDNCSNETIIQTEGLPSGSTFPLGTTTNTFEVTDANGNKSTCSFDVTVYDAEAPSGYSVSIDQTEIYEENESALSFTITGAEVGATYNYTISSSEGVTEITGTGTISTATQQVSGIDVSALEDGTITLSITLTDSSGNTGEPVTDTVLKSINTLPEAICKNFIAQLGEDGTVTISPEDVDGGSKDAEGEVTLSLDVDTFDCNDIGEQTLTLTVTDSHGETASCTATVTVEDNIAPVITAPQDITIDTDPGVCFSSNVNLGAPAITENCDSVLIQWDMENAVAGQNFIAPSFKQTFIESTLLHGGQGIEDHGSNVYVTRQFGSIKKPVFDLTLNDGIFVNTLRFTHYHNHNQGYSTNPSYYAQLQVDAGGNGNYVDIGEPVLLSQATHNTTDIIQVNTYLPAGENSFRFNAVGLNGNTHTGSEYFAIDNVEITHTLVINNDAPEEFPVGQTIVTWTATDGSGNTASVTQNVTVEDNVAPVVVTQNITVQLDAEGNATISPEMIDNGSSDACGISEMSLDNAIFDCSNIGENTVVLTVTDHNGNESSAEATVTVEDKVAPAVVTQHITIQLDAEGNATITPEMIDNGSSDACGILEMSLDITTFDCSNVGDNTVVLTVTDNNGNESSAEATVTVEDKVAPAVVTQHITIQLNDEGNATITPEMIDNGSSDACGILEMSLNITTFDCSDIGENTVVLTVTDHNGNESSAEATVTVEDKVAPAVVTQHITIQLDAEGNATITPEMIDNGSSDACGISEMSLDNTIFDCSNIGENSVVLTVTDNNGNESSAEARVTVEDNIAPVVLTQNITVQLDSEGNATISPELIDNGSGDACGISEMSLDITIFDCSNVGENTVVLTVVDTNGNESSAEAIVTVEDKVAPEVVTQHITVQLNDEGNATITPEMIDNGSSDACGISEMSLNITTFDCSNVGENTVVLTVTDNNGNTASAEATVTVEDNVAPVVVTRDITIQLNDEGNANITPEMIDNGSSDACGISEMNLDNAIFDCSNIGENTIVLTVTDNNGNTSSAEATVTVEDNVAPVVVTQNITVQLDAEVNATISPAMIDNGSSDACGISEMSLDNAIFDCSNIGENTVVLTVTDNNGNESSAEATVTVEDNIGPVVLTQNITIQLDAEGNASITPEMIDNGSSDACGILEMSLNITTFDCSDIGENTVVLTVTDNNGNESSAEATVTVEDKIAPVVVTRDISIKVDESGMAVITAEDVVESATDNCGIDSITLSRDLFDCTAGVDSEVIVTVTDINGNSTTAIAKVTVLDEMAPIVFARDIVVELDKTGSATISPEDIYEDAFDNCGIASMSLDISSFGCDDLGSNTVLLSVTDFSGNTATVEANVEVKKQPGSFACEPEKLRASEAMTPNGDGINDTWRVVDIEDHPNSLVIIYNRWGKEVYRKSSYKNDWDGRYNGDMLPEGSYYFQIYLDGKNMDKDGWLYLTR
jgi:gliding motility-associated-like protein